MHRLIQIRNVPEQLHRQLKVRAATAGLTLSDYVLHEIKAAAERPTVAELRERLSRRSPVLPKTSSTSAVRAERDSR